MSKPVIGVVGNGVVGSATAKAYRAAGYTVNIWDTVPHRRQQGWDETVLSGVVFLCLPSPRKADGTGCDVSAIENVCELIADTRRTTPSDTAYVLRSTVPVGTTRRLAEKYGLPLVHSPEFLDAATATRDAADPAVNIVGGTVGDPEAASVAASDLYRTRFPGVPLLVMRADESEAVKLVANAFFAVKNAFFNEVYAYCRRAGLDYSAVREGVVDTGRVGAVHTLVPGPDGKVGFGGACLPTGFTAVDETGKLVPVESVRPGQRIRSTNAGVSRSEVKKVVKTISTAWTGNLIVLRFVGGEIRCTPDHLFPVVRDGILQLVRADGIRTTDKLLRSRDAAQTDPPVVRNL